jgi:membrane-associated phospholipid phosphatase
MRWLHFVTDFGDMLCVTAAALVVLAWSWTFLNRLTASAFGLAYVVAVASTAAGKMLAQQFFPPVQEASVWTLSDGAPSGHVTLSILVYGVTAWFCLRSGRSWLAILGVFASVGIVAGIIVTRVGLHAHTIPDVTAGVGLGALVLSFPVWISQTDPLMPRPSVRWLLIGILVAAVLLQLSGLRVRNDFGLL